MIMLFQNWVFVRQGVSMFDPASSTIECVAIVTLTEP